jgi:hypothetical protein
VWATLSRAAVGSRSATGDRSEGSRLSVLMASPYPFYITKASGVLM